MSKNENLIALDKALGLKHTVKEPKKSSSAVADSVLSKTAVSRWREAIYSGELPLEQREKLKAYMGSTPERFMEGSAKGRAAVLDRAGYRVVEPEAKIRNAFKQYRAKELSGKELAEIISENFAIAQTGSQSSALTKSITHTPTKDLSNFAPITILNKNIPNEERRSVLKRLFRDPSLRKELETLVLNHEAGESTLDVVKGGSGAFQVPSSKTPKPVSLLRRPGMAASSATVGALDALAGEHIGPHIPSMGTTPHKKPLEYIARILNRKVHDPHPMGMHATPEVLLHELRGSRMMSPELQSIQRNVRNITGEYGPDAGDLRSMFVPEPKSKEWNQLAQKLQRNADDIYAPADKITSTWYGRGRGAINRLEKSPWTSDFIRNLKSEIPKYLGKV